MTITAKVRQRAIDTGKVISLVQAQHQADTIVFQIQGEDAALGEYSFYLLYMRPSDTIPHVELLSDPVVTTEGYVCVSFSPHSYFTAEDGTVKIQLLGCEEADLTVDPNTGTISGSKLWESLQGFVFIHASQLNATETIIEENVLTQYLAGMQDLNTATEQAATEAQQAAEDAGDSAEAAAGSATAAMNAKTDAEAARDKAEDWATKSDGKVDNIDYSSKHYASAAKASEQKASEWAEKETAVEPGKYSAKHWAEQAHEEFNALDTYVDETLKPALDDHEEAKEGELDTYTATKKAELDTYEDSKETELNTYTGTKKTELDTYTGAKKSELDSYVANTNKPALDNYTNNTLKPALLAYEQTQEGTLNTYTGTKKTELDSYVENTTKPSIDDYIEDEKKPEIDAYIAEQAGQFGADVTTLKGNVSALDKRVSNLEESLDVITEIEYPDATYGTGEVPPNKSKYAEVSVLKGVGRLENQLADNPTFDVKGDWTGFLHASTVTVSNNVLTAVENNSNDRVGFGRYLRTTANHSYLCLIRIDSATSGLTLEGGIRNFLKTVSVGFNALVITTNANSTEVGVASTVGISGATVSCSLFNLKDLNTYFNTSDLSFLGSTDSAKLATIQQKYPWLLIPSDYGKQAVFPTYEAVKSIGFNRFDKTKITTGKVIDYEGNIVDGTGFSVSDFMPIKSGGHYYLKSTPIQNVYQVHFYDASKNWIGRILGSSSNTDFYALAGACYVRINIYTSNVDDVNFNVSDSSLNGQTFPYMTDTLTLSSPVTLKGAGAVSEKYYPETGKITHPISTHNLGNMSYTYVGVYGSATNVFTGFMEGKIVNSSTLANALCEAYIVATNDYLYSHDVACISFADASPYLRFRINDPTFTRQSGESDADYVARFMAHLADKMLYMERATPFPDTYVDPIPDPFIQVEGGGTIKPVQTNETEIDSAMTVTYVNKITA